MQQSTFSWEEPPVNHSASQDFERALMILEVNSCSRLVQSLLDIDPSGWRGKTSLASFRVTKDATLQAFWDLSQANKFTPLEKVGVIAESSLDTVAPMELRGAYLTLNTSEFPSDAAESSLSDILETGDLPQRYFLSAKACAGILRRAEARGRELPPLLREALEHVAQTTTKPKQGT